MLKKINRWHISAIAWFVLSVLFVFFIRNEFKIWRIDEYNIEGLTYSQVNLSTSNVSQQIVISDPVQRVNFLMVNEGEDASCQVEIRDIESNEVFWEENLQVIGNGGTEQVVSLGMPEFYLQEGIYYLNFVSSTSDKLFVCVSDKSFDVKYMENDESFQKHIRMQVVYGAFYDVVLIGLITVALLLVGWSIIYAIKVKLPVEKLFVVCSLSFGVLFAFINPFGQEADGWVHFLRAMDVSNGNLLLPLWDNNGASELFRLQQNFNETGFIRVDPDNVTAPKFVENIRELYFSKELVEAESLGGYSSFFYYPQAIGVSIARLFGLSAFWWMVFGRIINLICYTGLTYIGIKKTPVYKNIFIVIALLPMSIYQAASVSYDALINSISFLFIGLCFNLAYGNKEKLNWKDTLPLGIALAFLFVSKYIYICLGLLVFLIPKEKFGKWSEYLRAFAISLIPIVLFAGMMVLPSLIALVGNPTSGVEQGVAEMTQIGYVLQNPIRYIKILIMTLVNHFEFYIKIFNTLGWMNYSLSHMQFFVPLFMMIVAVLDTNRETEKVKILDKGIMILTFILVLAFGMTGIYLFDSVANPVGVQVVSGYQPRYAIPGMIVLLSFFTSHKVKNEIKHFSYGVVSVMASFLLYSVLTVFTICY